MDILTTNAMVEQLVSMLCDQSAVRQAYLLRQSLFALVRLAKIEHQSEIRRDVAKATGLPRATASRRMTKKLLERMSSGNGPQQGQLKFD